MSSLAIVHLLPALVKGGGERAAVDLANWQAGKGHRVTMLVGRRVDDTLLRNDLSAEVEVRYISHRAGKFGRYFAGLNWLFRNRSRLEMTDVLHAHLTFAAVMATIVYYLRGGRNSRQPLLVETYHAVGMPIPRWVRAIHAWMARRRDAVIFMAEDRYWTGFRGRENAPPTAIIPNGLPVAARMDRSEPVVRAYARDADIAQGSLVVGNIGRLVGERRPDLLADVLLNVAGSSKLPLTILVVGEGPERAAIERKFADAGLSDRLRMPGLARQPAIPLALMDIYVSMNVGAITGLAGVQAAQAGVPVVGIQLDDGHAPAPTDWIWSSASAGDVATEVLRLLSDADARHALARKQQAYAVANFSIDRMGEAYEALYRRVSQSDEAAPCAA